MGLIIKNNNGKMQISSRRVYPITEIIITTMITANDTNAFPARNAASLNLLHHQRTNNGIRF